MLKASLHICAQVLDNQGQNATKNCGPCNHFNNKAKQHE